MDHTIPRDRPDSATADHITPVGLGGHIHGPMYGAHRVCNMRRRQQPITDDLRARLAALPLEWDTRTTTTTTPRHSQPW